MKTNKSNRKEFSEEQKSEIIRLRKEGKSRDTIAHFLHVGKDRVGRFCKQNNIGMGKNQDFKGRPWKYHSHTAEAQVIVAEYPDFSLAACRGESIDTFFPKTLQATGGNKAKIHYHQMVKRAIGFCEQCPIRESCLEYAIQAEPHGIWGGTTEEEREYIRLKVGIRCEREVGNATRMVRRHVQAFTYKNTLTTKYDKNPFVQERIAKRA